MKINDEVQALTGKFKGCFGTLIATHRVRIPQRQGGYAIQQKCVVRFDELDKTVTYNRYNIKKA